VHPISAVLITRITWDDAAIRPSMVQLSLCHIFVDAVLTYM
jgi:hypothetical protein